MRNIPWNLFSLYEELLFGYSIFLPMSDEENLVSGTTRQCKLDTDDSLGPLFVDSSFVRRCMDLPAGQDKAPVTKCVRRGWEVRRERPRRFRVTC